MSDTRQRAAEFVQLIPDHRTDEMKQALHDEFIKSTPMEFREFVSQAETLSRKTPEIQDLYFNTEDFEVTQVFLDDGFLGFDSEIFSRDKSEAAELDKSAIVEPLANEELEELARKTARIIEKSTDSGLLYGDDVLNAKRAVRQLLDVAVSLPENDRNHLIARTQYLNEQSYDKRPQHVPLINVLFSDTDGDGKRDDLCDVTLSYRLGEFSHKEVTTIDLWNP